MRFLQSFTVFYVFFVPILMGQESQGIEIQEPDYIKTIIFKSENSRQQFPIVRLGEPLFLQFDDLRADEANYYYKVKHFDFDWQSSRLFSNEYLGGFDNLRIDNYQTSFNALQRYTHYELVLPNANTRFLVSGNYMLEIYNDYGDLIFSRKFCVYEEKSNVQVGAYRPQNLEVFTTHQSVHFFINPAEGILRNTEELLQVAVLQNYQWDSAITNLKPQFFNGTTIGYRYEKPSQFGGGNEYLFFDTKDLRVSTANISAVRKKELYESYLFVDVDRQWAPYTFGPDINGDFEPRTLLGTQNPAIEADYNWVYFSLAKEYVPDGSAVYIYGKFNNYTLNDINRMYYNPESGLFEGVLLLKQGFYNYKYVVQRKGELSKNEISGTHALAENEYTVLVYYRDLGRQYDMLIGVGQTNSFDLHL